MLIEREIIVTNPKGVHTRAAAILSFKADQINSRYGVKLYLREVSGENKVPITSMHPLTSMKIKSGDRVVLGCEGDKDCKKALDEMQSCISGPIDVDNEDIDEVDKVLDHTTLTSDLLIESITNGVVAVNADNIVILFNKAAEKITGINRAEVLGHKANEVFESSKFRQVLDEGKPLLETKQVFKNATTIKNITPIQKDGKTIGAVAVLQDISEVERLSHQVDSILEVKDRFGNILNYANDGICMVDGKGRITFANPTYEKIWNSGQNSLLGITINKGHFNSAISKAIETGKKQLGIVDHREDGVKIVSNATPIVINKSFKGVVTISKEITEYQRIIDKLNEAEEKVRYFKEELEKKENIHEAFNIIIGKSKALGDAFSIASKAAKTSATVLIHGESGTGKELLAKAIVSASSRKDKPFIRLNCATIPDNLLESELFGHVRGSFTGAIQDKPGKFELADGGTIFLDEIGDISKEMQVKLLRVLQEREFERVGGTQTIKVNVRVIAATNRNLREMMEQGNFREDLYYRLNVIPITLPPLRDRKGDIPLLAEYFAEKICSREDIPVKIISKRVMNCFEKYHWPGNIRELENIIERAVALQEGDLILEDCLPNYIRQDDDAITGGKLVDLSCGELKTLDEYEREIIKAALEKYKSFNKVSKVLGITHRTVSLKAEKYGLKQSAG